MSRRLAIACVAIVNAPSIKHPAPVREKHCFWNDLDSGRSRQDVLRIKQDGKNQAVFSRMGLGLGGGDFGVWMDTVKLDSTGREDSNQASELGRITVADRALGT